MAQRVLITAGAAGIGREFARAFAATGAKVFVCDIDDKNLAALAEEIPGLVAQRCDMGSRSEIERMVPAAVHALGGLDVLINNAGIGETGPALSVTEAQWDAQLDVNLKGCFFAAQAAARIMTTQDGGGAIVNIASILGERVMARIAPYAISKAGLIQMTKVLALEWARHAIRVNALAPGYVITDINRAFFESDEAATLIKRIPTRRIGDPEDLDGPLLLLCSDAGRHMTGVVIPVDGGHLVSGL